MIELQSLPLKSETIQTPVNASLIELAESR